MRLICLNFRYDWLQQLTQIEYFGNFKVRETFSRMSTFNFNQKVSYFFSTLASTLPFKVTRNLLFSIPYQAKQPSHVISNIANIAIFLKARVLYYVNN